MMMQIWFLILILATNTEGLEQHVLIEMPDEVTCYRMLNSFVHTVASGADSNQGEWIMKDKVCRVGKS